MSALAHPTEAGAVVIDTDVASRLECVLATLPARLSDFAEVTDAALRHLRPERGRAISIERAVIELETCRSRVADHWIALEDIVESARKDGNVSAALGAANGFAALLTFIEHHCADLLATILPSSKDPN